MTEEIRQFKALGRGHRILAVIVAGTPHARDPAQECFPAALKVEVGADGELTTRQAEPLATDVRKFGREDSLLRLVSGILQVDYDVLKNRERLRLRAEARRNTLLFAGAMTLLVMASLGLWGAYQSALETSYRESLRLAELAKQQNDEGHYDTGLLLALEALPSGHGQFIAQAAQTAIIEAMRAAYEGHVPLELKHADTVDSAVFSPDGARVVTVSRDNTARLWDSMTGTPLGIAMKHDDYIFGAASSTDGARLVTASRDHTARLWDGRTGAPLGQAMKHDQWVRSAAFSFEGGRIVTASSDFTAHLWDGETGADLGVVMTHEGDVTGATFSPDGTRIVTASADHTARLWDAKTGAPFGPIMKHADVVWSATLSPDGTRVLTTSRDYTARLWDVETGTPLGQIMEHNHDVRGGVFSPDGGRVVTVSEGGTARLWDGRTGVPLGMAMDHDDIVWTAVFSPDGNRVLTASADDTARLWDGRTGAPLGQVLTHDSIVWSAAFSPDGRRVVTASSDAVGESGKAQIGDIPEGSTANRIARFGCQHLADARPALTREERRDFFVGKSGSPCDRAGLLSLAWWREAASETWRRAGTLIEKTVTESSMFGASPDRVDHN